MRHGQWTEDPPLRLTAKSASVVSEDPAPEKIALFCATYHAMNGFKDPTNPALLEVLRWLFDKAQPAR